MCGHHVIEHVRSKMLSRRGVLTGSLGAAAAVGGTTLLAPPAVAATSGGTLTDLTHTLSSDFPTYGGEPGIEMTQVFNFADNGFNLFNMDVNEHTGTHMDAPLHFSADGQSVDELPVATLMAPLVKIDIAERAADNPDAQLTPDDIDGWVSAHGDLPESFIVAMDSGWSEKAGGKGFRNADDEGVMHFPGFHVEAAQKLLETGCVGMAVDTLSLDHGPSADFKTHYAWLPTNRWGLENVAGLGALPASGATMIVGAPKHRGGTGGPTRVMALV